MIQVVLTSTTDWCVEDDVHDEPEHIKKPEVSSNNIVSLKSIYKEFCQDIVLIERVLSSGASSLLPGYDNSIINSCRREGIFAHVKHCHQKKK